MQQVALVGFVMVVAEAVSSDLEPFVPSILVLVLVLGLMDPARREVLRFSGRPSGAMLAIAVAAAVPLVWFALHEAAMQRNVHVNAFNFPAWGLAEKAALAWLAGMPVITKPATATALVAERVVRILIDAKVLPDGALSFLCGSVGDLRHRHDDEDLDKALASWAGIENYEERLLPGRIDPIVLEQLRVTTP